MTSLTMLPGGLEVERVEIRKHPVSAVSASVRADYEEKFGEPPAEPGGWFHKDDWPRVSYVIDMLQPGSDVLDVGAGAGQFLNMLARSGRFRSVVGVDKARFTKYSEFEPDMRKLDGDISALQFEDDSFDVVTCMEVLEHLPPDVFVAGLAELRRVCRGQLIMSVPFCEPEPISATHVRRFEADDILEMFPNATYTLLDRSRMPWITMEERFDGTTLPDARSAATAEPGPVDPRDAEIARLKAKVAALQQRKAIRAANLLGQGVRRAAERFRR